MRLLPLVPLLACADSTSSLDATWYVGGAVDHTGHYTLAEGVGNNTDDGTMVSYWTGETGDEGEVSLSTPTLPSTYDAMTLAVTDASPDGQLDGSYTLQFDFIGLTDDPAHPVRWTGRFSSADGTGVVADTLDDGVVATLDMTNVCDGSVESEFAAMCGLRFSDLQDPPDVYAATFTAAGAAGPVDPTVCPEDLWSDYAGGTSWTWSGGDLDLGNGTTVPCLTTTVDNVNGVAQAALCGEVREDVAADGCTWTTSFVAPPGNVGAYHAVTGGWFNARSEDCDRRCSPVMASSD
jgi:hypothetical protein